MADSLPIELRTRGGFLNRIPLIPSAPILSLINEFWDSLGRDTDREYIARRLGVSEDRIRRLFEQENISFDLADKIVTNHPLGPMLWWQRDDLRKIYLSADLSRCEVPRDAHGSRTTYTMLGCRCKECKQANTEYWRQKRGSKPRSMPEHGTRAMYQHKCRCEPCKKASSDYFKARRKAGKA